MTRPAKPVQLHLLNGNKRHLTQEEIADRQQQEAKLRSGVKTYKPNAQVRNDKTALTMFKKLQKLYKGIDYVEGLDENIINRYCLLYSEYMKLRETRQELQDRVDKAKRLSSKLAWAEQMLDIDKRIDKKMDLLLKLEDRLFLNPTARIKNVPKKEKETKDPFGEMFD